MQALAIIPAAGQSRRMGRPKLLLPWGDTTVIEQVLAVWRASRVTHTIVVVRDDDERLAEVCAAAGAIVVRAAEPPPEMKDSIALGLARAAEFKPAADDVWLVAPADLPTLSPAVIDRVLQAFADSSNQPEAAQVWLPRSGGRRGHPVAFAWRLAGEVSRLGDDEGLNALFARHPVGTIEVEPAALGDDLDTPEDYERQRPRGEP